MTPAPAQNEGTPAITTPHASYTTNPLSTNATDRPSIHTRSPGIIHKDSLDFTPIHQPFKGSPINRPNNPFRPINLRPTNPFNINDSYNYKDLNPNASNSPPEVQPTRGDSQTETIPTLLPFAGETVTST